MFLAIIWYYSVVFISFVERLAAKCVQCLLIVYKLVGPVSLCFVERVQTILLLQVTGTRGDDKVVKEKPPVSEASSSKSERTSSSVSTSPKKRKQHKVNDEPKFSTKLTVPIETIIEETLNEELSDSHSSTTERAVISKPRRKKKSLKKEKNKSPTSAEEQPDLEESDFVFVKSKKSSDKESKNTASTAVEPAPVKSVTNKPKTAKDKSLLEKRNSAEALTSVIAQSITKKRDPLSTPIIEHYKSSSTSNVEVKESKKVCPKVSYASVVTKNIPAEETQIVNECLEEKSASPNSELSNVTVTEDLIPVQTEESLLTIPGQPELPQYFPDTIKEIDEILQEEFGELSSEGISSPEYLVGGFENDYVSEQESEINIEDPLQDLEDEIIEQPFIVEECEVEVLNVDENSAFDVPQVNKETENQDQTDQNLIEGVVNDCLSESLKKDQISQSSIPEVQNTVQQDQIDIKPSIESDRTELLNESLTELLECQVQSLQNQVTETLFPQVNISAAKSVETNFVTQNLEELSEGQQVTEDIVNQDKSTQPETFPDLFVDQNQSIEGTTTQSLIPQVSEETVYQEKQNSSIENINQNLTDFLEEQIQSLEDQIVQESFVIEESEVVYPINSVSDTCEDTGIHNTTVEVPQDIGQSEEMVSQIRILTLNDKEHQECTIYRIEKKVILQFRLGPTLLGRKIRLYCNYPVEINGILTEFERSTYQELSWCQDEGCKHSDDTASFAEIIPTLAGSFHYYFVDEEG